MISKIAKNILETEETEDIFTPELLFELAQYVLKEKEAGSLSHKIFKEVINLLIDKAKSEGSKVDLSWLDDYLIIEIFMAIGVVGFDYSDISSIGFKVIPEIVEMQVTKDNLGDFMQVVKRK